MQIRYGFNDVPKTYEAIVLGFQHVLAAVVAMNYLLSGGRDAA
jgi:xanthine/uracil permease